MIEFDEATHTYRVDGRIRPSVTSILVDGGFIDTTWFTEEGRNRGTNVHKAVSILASSGMDGSVEGYGEAWEKFVKDCGWKPYQIEQPMANNLYAGTPDQFGFMYGVTDSVLDLKSGEVPPCTGLQLQGYKDLDGPKSQKRRYALQLKQNGTYRLTEFKDKSDEYIWRSAVAIYHWKRNHLI